MWKYWHVINLGIQSTLVYRLNFLFRSVVGLVPLAATLYLWRAIYAGQAGPESVGGYSLAHMVSYYLVAMVVDSLTAVTDDDWQIAADIREGNINHFLLKPVDYLAYRLCLFGAGRLVYTAVALVPMALVIVYLHQYLVWPDHLTQWLAFLVSMVLSGLIQFLLSYTLALVSFWVLEVSAFILMVFALEYIASGHLFPLDILPAGLLQGLLFTPFPYQLFLPVSIFLGQTRGEQLWHGLALQAVWVVLLYGLARWVWSRGIRKYSAVGG